MKGRYLKRIGGLILAALMLSGVAFVSPGTAEAQTRRRVIIVRKLSSILPAIRLSKALWLRSVSLQPVCV